MGYDDIIPVIGGFGRYQKCIYFLLCLPAILCAFHKMGKAFLLGKPEYRCKLPDELPNATYTYILPINHTLLVPNDTSLQSTQSSCEMLVNNETKTCDEFIFDQKTYGYTAVIEWELTCEKAYLVATGNSIFMVGVMLGSILFGEMSDRYGRKPIFFLSLVLQVIFGGLAAIAPEFWTFTICRAVIGMTTSGVFLVAYVIAMEMVGASKRLIAGTVCHAFFSIGYMLTALFAYYIHNWRHLQAALTAPGTVFFCYWWFVPESTRWLLSKGRITEAKRLIRRAAHVNRVTVSDDQLDDLLLHDMIDNGAKATDKPAHNATILDIFRHTNMRRKSLIIFFDWFANNITYYGLSWNTNNLAGNPYLNFVVSGAVEIPAYTFLLLTLNRWGRKPVMCCCMIAAGVALLCTVAIPSDHQWAVVALAMFGKLAITASYGTIYIFSTEQFPTVIRNAGLGLGSTCARVGSITTPYVNVLSKIWNPLPLIIFGSIAFVGGFLSLYLPETLNKRLPETIEEGETFGQSSKKLSILENGIKMKGDNEENRNGDICRTEQL